MAPVRTLLDRWPRTEDRGADPHVCRAAPDRLLEVAAHAGRDHGGLRVVGDAPARRPRRAAGTPRAAASPSGATAITPRSRSPASPTRVAAATRGRRRVRRRPALGAGRVEADLDQAVERPDRARRRRGQGRDELGPVDRLDDVAVAGDRCSLVALDRPDEVPGEVEVGAGGGLRGRPPGGGSPPRRSRRARRAAGRRTRGRTW